jgi:hypothetical protein
MRCLLCGRSAFGCCVHTPCFLQATFGYVSVQLQQLTRTKQTALLRQSMVQDPARHAAGERAIVAFRQCTNALPASLHVLQHSASADACFHAALALRIGALESWPRLPLAERKQLREWACTHALQRGGSQARQAAGGVETALLKAVVALHAVLLKRLWVDLQTEEQHHVLAVCCKMPYLCLHSLCWSPTMPW